MTASSYPYTHLALVRYFYLPATKERHAEVIEVLNSYSDTVIVPMREEDVALESFFERPLSEREAAAYLRAETWKLFSTWEEIKQDHFRFGLSEEQLQQLLQYKDRYDLQEEMAA